MVSNNVALVIGCGLQTCDEGTAAVEDRIVEVCNNFYPTFLQTFGSSRHWQRTVSKWSIGDHASKTYVTETSTSWDRGRDQDEVLWDRDRGQKSDGQRKSCVFITASGKQCRIVKYKLNNLRAMTEHGTHWRSFALAIISRQRPTTRRQWDA